jgi:hypothetical protein
LPFSEKAFSPPVGYSAQEPSSEWTLPEAIRPVQRTGRAKQPCNSLTVRLCSWLAAFLMKSPMAGPQQQEEKTMKLVTNHELQKRSDSELSALFCTVSQGLVRTKRGSPERRNALASLENISRARAVRIAAPGQ